MIKWRKEPTSTESITEAHAGPFETQAEWEIGPCSAGCGNESQSCHEYTRNAKIISTWQGCTSINHIGVVKTHLATTARKH